MPLPRERGFAVAQLTCWLVALILAGHSGGEALAEDKAAATSIGSETTVAGDEPASRSVEELRSRERELLRTAAALHREGQFGTAVDATRELTAVRKQLLGEKHPGYAACLNNLGELYRLRGQYRVGWDLVHLFQDR